MVFRISSCQWLGFDLDHTVIRYNVPALEELEFTAFKQYFMNHLDYPKELRDISFDATFCFRGIVVHLSTGNMLKIDSDKRVVKGYHGSRLLSQKELQTNYPDPLNYDGSHTDEYWSISTFFEAGVAPLWRGLVDILDKHEDGPVNYPKILTDLRKGIDFNFGTFPEGYFFPDIVQHPEKYLFKRDDLVEWLKQIQSTPRDGKAPIKLFLLTNSNTDYTKFLGDYCLGNNWESLFELVLFMGRKPSFWNSESPSKFQRVVLEQTETNFPTFNLLGEANIDINEGRLYTLGNGKELHAFFEESIPNGEELKVCYVGDHITGDCVHCKLALDWHVITIAEELEHQHGSHVPIEEIHTECNQWWGSYFSTIHETGKPKKTFWAQLISKYVDLAIPCLSCLMTAPLTLEHNPSDHILSPCAIFHTQESTRTKYYTTVKNKNA